MISAGKIKYIHSLRLGKFRDKHYKFVAEGSKLVKELIAGRMNVDEIFASEEWLNENMGILQNINFQLVTPVELKKISNLVTPGSALAIVDIPDYGPPDGDYDNPVVVLDGISDPGNMGTIIRTSDWFGLEEIFCSTDSVDVYNPKVVQSTMGSIARVKVRYVDTIQFLKDIQKDTVVMGAFMQGDSVFNIGVSRKTAIVFGNEARGIRQELLPFISQRVTIPLIEKSGIRPESLNVSVSHAIFLSEFTRKKVS